MDSVDLEKLVQVLSEGVAQRNKCMDALESLLEKSEARIDKTNEMILHLTAVINSLTSKYVEHLDTISNNRDFITEQNTLLIKQIAELQSRIDYIEASHVKEMETWKQLVHDLAGSRGSGITNNIK